jgi:hypothetical protein
VGVSNIRTSALDKLFSQAVRLRDGYTCRYSGMTDGIMDCAHVTSRRHVWTRWDMDNAVCLSRKWHMHFTPEPHAWADWTRKELGHSHVEAVLRRAQLTDKYTDEMRIAKGEWLIDYIKAFGVKPVCGIGRRLSKVKKKKSGLKRKVNGEVVAR